MLRIQYLPANRQGTLVERLGLLVLAPGLVKQPEIVEAVDHIRVGGAERLLVNRLSLLQERLGRFILLLGDKLLCINCIDSIDCIDPIGMWEYITWILSHLILSFLSH